MGYSGAAAPPEEVVVTNNNVMNASSVLYADHTSSSTVKAVYRGNTLDSVEQSYKGADIASASTIAIPDNWGTFYDVTGTTSITSVTASWAGRVVVLQFDGVLTFTDGSNLKLAGNMTTAASDTITLICDGTDWFEMCRSANST